MGSCLRGNDDGADKMETAIQREKRIKKWNRDWK
jgi:hypothetical protein